MYQKLRKSDLEMRNELIAQGIKQYPYNPNVGLFPKDSKEFIPRRWMIEKMPIINKGKIVEFAEFRKPIIYVRGKLMKQQRNEQKRKMKLQNNLQQKGVNLSSIL